MSNKDNHQNQFNASLPLPDEANIKHTNYPSKQNEAQEPQNAAADIIRKRIASAYANEPNLKVETQEVKTIPEKLLSRHQEFILNLTESGRPMHEIQQAWHEYYSALQEAEKHQVWDEFYSSNPNLSKNSQSLGFPEQARARAMVKQLTNPITKTTRHAAIQRVKHRANTRHNIPEIKSTAPSPVRSLIFGLSVGGLLMLVFLFGFFNQQFIAPFIQPSRKVTSVPIISTAAAISPNPEVIIPKINVQIPVVYDIPTIDEAAVEKGLESGVVHYADTAMPGQNGNVVIVGHSSNNIFNPGKYKFAFVLLSKMDAGDTFFLQKDGKRYTYQIYDKKVVKPTDVSVLGPQTKTATVTLITCDPPGTSANRLVVTAEQIDPAVNTNAAPVADVSTTALKTAIIPGNSPSLWSRLVKWLSY